MNVFTETQLARLFTHITVVPRQDQRLQAGVVGQLLRNSLACVNVIGGYRAIESQTSGVVEVADRVMIQVHIFQQIPAGRLVDGMHPQLLSVILFLRVINSDEAD